MSKLEKVEKAIEKGKEAALIKLAYDKDEEVRLAAIAGMGKIGKDDSFNAIVPDMLTSDDAKIRAAAAEALGVMNNEHASAHLRYYLEREKDATVVAAMNKAISSLRNYVLAFFGKEKRPVPVSRHRAFSRLFYSRAASHSPCRKPTSTLSPSRRMGRFTSMPSLASRASCSSWVMWGSLSFRPKARYCWPLVLKKRFRGRPL